ncbi:MAG: hypothetical protein IKV41_00225 [Oscillospiraceae bacterium]|nr:hypothetical protein [Oscillospiraceae bacterium]
MKNEMEAKFSKFIDNKVYDSFEQLLFDIVRSAYRSGWNDAVESCCEQNAEKSC